MREIEYENYIFYIGQNAKENWELLDKLSKINNEYIWFHLNSFPSPYVIVNSTISDLSKSSHLDDVLLFGSQLCKDYSKYKYLSNGILADIAPTILHIMGLKPTKEMTGKTLIK